PEQHWRAGTLAEDQLADAELLLVGVRLADRSLRVGESRVVERHEVHQAQVGESGPGDGDDLGHGVAGGADLTGEAAGGPGADADRVDNQDLDLRRGEAGTPGGLDRRRPRCGLPGPVLCDYPVLAGVDESDTRPERAGHPLERGEPLLGGALADR